MSNLRFDVELTNACNARCVYCPHPRMPRPIGYMSWATWERVVEQAKAADILRLSVAGFGEPTLHPHIIDFLKWARAQLPDKWIQLETNASRLWCMDLDALAETRLTDIVISFNGYSPESYEHFMRGLSFEETLRGMTLLTERLRGTETEIRIRSIRFPPDPEASRHRRPLRFFAPLGSNHAQMSFIRCTIEEGFYIHITPPPSGFARNLSIHWQLDGTVLFPYV